LRDTREVCVCLVDQQLELIRTRERIGWQYGGASVRNISISIRDKYLDLGNQRYGIVS
jgi:hypothetical protein